MSGRARYHPLRLASGSLWGLGIFYLMAGLMAFVVQAFREPSPGAFAAASVWLLPGVAYLLAASCAKPGRRWPLAVGLACTAVVTLGLSALLGWMVLFVGPYRLAAWRVPLASEVALLMALLVVYQGYLIHHLIGAWRAAAAEAADAVGRGFGVGLAMPVRMIDFDAIRPAASERDRLE